MTKCTNCGSRALKWHVGVKGPSDVVDGRLRMSEVRPMAYLACKECSETLAVVEEDEVNRMLGKYFEEKTRAELRLVFLDMLVDFLQHEDRGSEEWVAALPKIVESYRGYKEVLKERESS